MEKLIFFHVNRLKLVLEEGRSIISLVHIMLQVKATFSLKFLISVVSQIPLSPISY